MESTIPTWMSRSRVSTLPTKAQEARIGQRRFRYNPTVKTRLRFILISDDVRTEDNGKLIVIGLQGNEIHVPHLPVAIPLAFTTGIMLEGGGAFKLSGKLMHGRSGEELLTFWAKGEAVKGGIAYVPFKFGSIQFREPGTYHVSIVVAGDEEHLTESFEIGLSRT